MALSLVSYNVLASAYADAARYPDAGDEVLRPERRFPRVVERLVRLAPDVACLQEVEPASFDLARRTLGDEWTAVLARKGAGRPDGCATFARAAVWRRSERIEYDDGGPGRARSGHVALLAEIEHDGRSLAVANTHLRWDAPGTAADERWALRQVRGLLEALRSFGVAPDAWVVCGDLNVDSSDDAIRALLDAGLRDVFAGSTGSTAVANRRARRIDFVLTGASLNAQPDPLRALDPATALPNAAEPSDHVPVRVGLSWRARST